MVASSSSERELLGGALSRMDFLPPYHLLYFDQASLSYLLKRCGYEIMKAHHYEPFSGWVNALARTAVRTEPSAFEKPTATVTSEGAGKRRHNWLRSIWKSLD